MQINNNNLKIAIQKQGRLTTGSLELLKRAGLQFEENGKRLFSSCRNFPLDILFVRDDDIPEYVADAICDLGIVGFDIVKERQIKVKVLAELGFSRCSLDIAVPRQSGIKNIKMLEDKKIATSYPNVLGEYLRQNNVKANIVNISGSVELAPSLKVADAICDSVATGSTLKAHNLVSIAKVLESQAVLVSQIKANGKNDIIIDLLKRIKAVLQAQDKKYVLLNAPRNRASEIMNALTNAVEIAQVHWEYDESDKKMA